MILDDTIENKVGKVIEGSCDKLYSNKEKRLVRGLNVVSLNYSDGYSNFMLDFAIAMNKYARVKIQDFTNKIDYRTNAYKRRIESLKGKSVIAINMIKRAINNGIYANYILIDSWYSKPIFIKEMNELGLMTISRIANNNSIWNFKDKEKTLNAIYEKYRHTANIVSSSYGKIKFKYFCVKVTHKTAGKLKIVFIKTNNKIIPIVSTNLSLQAKEIIDIYIKEGGI